MTTEQHNPTVTFSIRWDDDYHVDGSLPASAAARVIEAVMAPTSIIHFDRDLSPEDAENIRRRFASRPGGAS